MIRLVKLSTSLHYHLSEKVVYSGTCWCIRGRHYDHGQPRETGEAFLRMVTQGSVNNWVSHMHDAYGIKIEKHKVRSHTEVKFEYQCLEEMTKQERCIYEDYEYINGPVTKKWVEELILHPSKTFQVTGPTP